MTLLAETRRLVPPPASNLPLTVDRSWASLLPGAGVVGIVGDAGEDVTEAVARFCDSIVCDPDDARGFSGLIIAGESVPQIAALAEHSPEAVVVVLPGGAVPELKRRWIVVEGRYASSRFRNRVRRAGDLALGRVGFRLGVVPGRLRGHASDVEYQVIPDDFESSPGSGRVSLGFVSGAPPDYLAAASSEAGWDVDAATWSFGRPRGFESQKIVFRLTSRGRPFIVKMTQHPRFNARLEAEATATERWSGNADAAFVVAEPLFSTTQGGVRVIGQALLEGRSVRTVADPDPRDAVIEAGFRAVLDLGARSSEPTTRSERDDALDRLTREFVSVYDPPAAVAEQLDEVRSRLGAVPLPSVFMHGDFALWNLLAEPDGRVGVLDWENADPRGVPLWDLFAYVRTVGRFLADVRGRRYTGSTFGQQFYEESPVRRAFDRWVAEYCSAVGIPLEAVEDLFTMCWVQQAMREAATLSHPSWASAQSTTFLAIALERSLEPIRP